MRRRVALMALVAITLPAVTACSRTKEDIIERAHNVTDRAALQKALGRADDITKLGPAEVWTYRASNGEVVFVVIGDHVTLQAAGRGEPKRR